MTHANMIRKTSRTVALISVLLALMFSSTVLLAQVNHLRSNPIGVRWPDETFTYGILTTGSPADSLSPMVRIVAVPGDSIAFDSLSAGTLVQYERLGEIQRLANEFRWEGEGFRVEHSGRKGWVNEQHLMIFAGFEPEPRTYPQRSFRRLGSNLVVLYSSRNSYMSFSSALALWTIDSARGEWMLRDLMLNAIETGLYMIPTIDSTSAGDKLVHVSSIGIDDDDMWGEKVTYEIRDLRLFTVKREQVREHRTDD